MTRVAGLILHAPAGLGGGPLTQAYAAIRRRNAERQAAGFRAAGAAEVRLVETEPDEQSFGARVRAAVAALHPDGLVVLGSGSVPLATKADRRAFLAAAGGTPGTALANNRFSADIVAVAGAARLADLPDLASDNGLPRWLAESAGYLIGDLRQRWRLQVDLDSPLDALLAGRVLDDSLPTDAVRAALAGAQAVARDPSCELIVAGRASATGLAWLERSTASRTRALIEERGFRTRAAGQRPAASTIGLLLDHAGPDALGRVMAGLGDAAVVDSRVLMAHHFGADERGWPVAEDRFASDLLVADRIADPWLRALTAAARDAAIPIVLGGHTLVGPGLRLVLAPRRPWS